MSEPEKSCEKLKRLYEEWVKESEAAGNPRRNYSLEYSIRYREKMGNGVKVPVPEGIPSDFEASPFGWHEEQDIYRRCVEQDCFWQDLPDVAKRVMEWEKETENFYKFMDDTVKNGDIALI